MERTCPRCHGTVEVGDTEVSGPGQPSGGSVEETPYDCTACGLSIRHVVIWKLGEATERWLPADPEGDYAPDGDDAWACALCSAPLRALAFPDDAWEPDEEAPRWLEGWRIRRVVPYQCTGCGHAYHREEARDGARWTEQRGDDPAYVPVEQAPAPV